MFYCGFRTIPTQYFRKDERKNERKKGVILADICLRTIKRGLFQALFGGGGTGFRTIPAHLQKAAGGGTGFRTIPAHF